VRKVIKVKLLNKSVKKQNLKCGATDMVDMAVMVVMADMADMVVGS
jgi:hypothetical protein